MGCDYVGLFSELFPQNSGSNNSDERIPAIMLPGALEQIHKGIVPTIHTDTQSEDCHFSERAILIAEKTQKRYVGNSSGFSFQICRGTTYRTNQRRGTPVEETCTEKNKGLLCITDKRIIFVSDKNHLRQETEKLDCDYPIFQRCTASIF